MPQHRYNLPRVIAVALLTIALPCQILAASAARPVIVNTTITNALTRYLTNVIEISIPNNVFVDEYRTNRVRRDVTNLVDLYQTNLVFQYRTNVLTVDRYATNLVTAWHTNVKTLTLTNWENLVLIRTNWVHQPVTNIVELTRTNFVRLTVTNWETVTVTTTNVVSRPSIGAVKTTQPIPSDAPTSKTAPRSAARADDLDRGLELELSYVDTPTEPGQFPIRLTLLSASGAALPVSEWRVEKNNGGGLMIGTKSDFSTVLPAGNYRITARVRTADGTIKSVRGDIEVKTDARAMRTSANIASAR